MSNTSAATSNNERGQICLHTPCNTLYRFQADFFSSLQDTFVVVFVVSEIFSYVAKNISTYWIFFDYSFYSDITFFTLGREINR